MEQAIVDGKVVSASAALTFLLGGNATFTFVSLKSGDRFTYLVQLGKRKKNPTDPDVFFVKLLTGPDNSNDFAYFGYIKNNTFFHGGVKACAGKDAPSVKGFMWAFAQFQIGVMPLERLEMLTASKCARCGRKLTVDDSIHNGFGPECISKVGYGAAPAITVSAEPHQVSMQPPTPENDPMNRFAAAKNLVNTSGRICRNAMTVSEMVEWKRVNDPEGFTMDGEIEPEEAASFWAKRFRTNPLTPAEMAVS